MGELFPYIILLCLILGLSLYLIASKMEDKGRLLLGNCATGAALIQLKYGGKITMTYRPGTRIPHWVVINCNDGINRHFTVIREIFPYPYGIALFWGKVEKF